MRVDRIEDPFRGCRTGEYDNAAKGSAPVIKFRSISIAIVTQQSCHVDAKNHVDADKCKHNIGPEPKVCLALSRSQRVVEELYTHPTQEKCNHVEVSVHEDEALYYV